MILLILTTLLDIHRYLTLIWVSILGVPFGEGGLSPYLKLIRILVEASHLARKCTYIYLVSENMLFTTKARLILLLSAFLCKKIGVFFDENNTFKAIV